MLVVPPAIHPHDGFGEEVVAEWSACHHASGDGEGSYTVINMVALLFINTPDVGGRLIRIGYFFSEAKVCTHQAARK